MNTCRHLAHYYYCKQRKWFLSGSVCLYKNVPMAQVHVASVESVSAGFDWSRCDVYTQESSGGGLLSMRPTAGLPALMKCFLSLIAWAHLHEKNKPQERNYVTKLQSYTLQQFPCLFAAENCSSICQFSTPAVIFCGVVTLISRYSKAPFTQVLQPGALSRHHMTESALQNANVQHREIKHLHFFNLSAPFYKSIYIILGCTSLQIAQTVF